MGLLFTISLKFLQQNILEISLTAKVIVSIIFSIKKNIVFLKKYLYHNYVRRHSRLRQIANLKKNSFHGNMPPNPMCSKTKRPQIPPTMIPQ